MKKNCVCFVKLAVKFALQLLDIDVIKTKKMSHCQRNCVLWFPSHRFKEHDLE